MGPNGREIEEIDAKVFVLENKLRDCKSHLASIEIMRQIAELKNERERLEKQGDNWIMG